MPNHPDIAILKDGFFKNPSKNGELDYGKKYLLNIPFLWT